MPSPYAHREVDMLHNLLPYSVVICAYTLDRWDDLCASVASALSQEPRPLEVIVVIDHNPELLSRAEGAFPPCTVLANAEQRGLSGARNTGIAQARGEVVAFVDDDARCEPGWAEHLLRPYSDPAVVGVGGGVLPDWRAPRPAWFPDEFLWVVGCSYAGQPTGSAPVRNGIGANMSFRRTALDLAGGFNHMIGRVGANAAGCEETELSVRAARAVPGGHVVLAQDAVVRHAVTPARTTRRYFRDRCRAEGQSKAIVSALVGQQDALSAERGYATRVLPAAFVRALIPRRGSAYQGGRSAAIAEGLLLTAGAYARQLARQRRHPVALSTATSPSAGGHQQSG